LKQFLAKRRWQVNPLNEDERKCHTTLSTVSAATIVKSKMTDVLYLFLAFNSHNDTQLIQLPQVTQMLLALPLLIFNSLYIDQLMIFITSRLIL